jgi:hypothetical protein
VRKAKLESLKDDATIGWDLRMALDLMDAYLPDDKNIPEEKKIDLWRSAAAIFNEERVFWMHRSRTLIRIFVHDIVNRKNEFELTENELTIYMTFGAVAGNVVEAKSTYEDWIGTRQTF